MSLTLLWPAALFGGIALILPWLLHRLPQRLGHRRRFAALRFIGQHTAPRRRPRIREWPLLLLRLLLLAVLVFWLAGPLWRDWPGLGLQWQALWPGASTTAQAAASPADRSVWLAPGFPPAGDPVPSDAATDAASLLAQLASSLPPQDRLRVLVPPQLDGIGPAGLQLARPVEWLVVEATPPARRGSPPKLALRSEPGVEAGPWLEAALAAWQHDPALASAIDRGPAEQPVPADVDALLWLGEQPQPRWLGAPRPFLQVAAEALQGSARRDLLSDLPWLPLAGLGARLAAPLQPADLPAVLDADFPRRLHHLLFHREQAAAGADAASLAPTADPALLAPPPLVLDHWLALLAALLFLAERWLANGRRLASA